METYQSTGMGAQGQPKGHDCRDLTARIHLGLTVGSVERVQGEESPAENPAEL
jgi:hypothetical protein